MCLCGGADCGTTGNNCVSNVCMCGANALCSDATIPICHDATGNTPTAGDTAGTITCKVKLK